MRHPRHVLFFIGWSLLNILKDYWINHILNPNNSNRALFDISEIKSTNLCKSLKLLSKFGCQLHGGLFNQILSIVKGFNKVTGAAIMTFREIFTLFTGRINILAIIWDGRLERIVPFFILFLHLFFGLLLIYCVLLKSIDDVIAQLILFRHLVIDFFCGFIYQWSISKILGVFSKLLHLLVV